MALTQSGQRNISAVQFVLNQVGANVAPTNSYSGTSAAIADSTTQSLASLSQIQEAKKAMASRLDNASNDPQMSSPTGGSGLMSQGMQIGVAAAVAFGSPVVAAGAAVIGAGLAVRDGVNFMMSGAQPAGLGHAGVSHAAIDGGVGEMGLHEQPEKYTDVSGDTYDVMSGQRSSAPPPQQQTSKSMVDPRKMGAAVDEAFKLYSPDEIRKSIEEIGTLEKQLLAIIGGNMGRMGKTGIDVERGYAKWNAENLEPKKPDGLDLPELGLVSRKPAVNNFAFKAPSFG